MSVITFDRLMRFSIIVECFKEINDSKYKKVKKNHLLFFLRMHIRLYRESKL